MELKIEDLKYRDILVHEETGVEYEVMGFDSNGKEIIFSSGEVANDLKYFKKKEQSQYTFDDLVDVAVQANKDRVINGFSVVGGVLNCQTLDGEDYNLGIGCEVAHGIEYLQSLYKETFVIETEEDLDRFNKDVEITLANDEKLSWEDLKSIGLMNTHAIFKTLKGAAVTQSK